VRSISWRHHSFSGVARSLYCTLAHSRTLWRFMFFSKRAFNALSSSSRCSGDNRFLLLLMLFIKHRSADVRARGSRGGGERAFSPPRIQSAMQPVGTRASYRILLGLVA